MSDAGRQPTVTEARVRRWRQRQAEQAALAEQGADSIIRRAAVLADQLEAEWPEQAVWLTRYLPPELAGDVIDELLQRRQERAGDA